MIRQAWDMDAGALYVTVTDARVARTVQVDRSTLVDVDAAGGLVGVEVIGQGYAWPVGEILARFPVAPEQAVELRAYFTPPSRPCSLSMLVSKLVGM